MAAEPTDGVSLLALCAAEPETDIGNSRRFRLRHAHEVLYHLRALLAMMTAFFWFAAAYGAVVSDKLTPLTVISASFFGWQFVIFMICIRYAKLEDIKAVPNVRQTHA